MKGWIALDIDGTITLDSYSVPKPVINYLKTLQENGWKIAIATGRPCRFALMALSEFDFPFVLLCQNGSVALEMPSKEILLKRYLPWDAIPIIEKAYSDLDGDFVVYMGVEKNDVCYFRPNRIPKSERPSIEAWQAMQKEKWVAQDRFTPELIPHFPIAKCFGPIERMQKLSDRFKKIDQFQVSMLRNPFDINDDALILVTDAAVSKGDTLGSVFKTKPRGERVIAAGDDENDISLLKIADVKIAMNHAPLVLKTAADIIAPPTKEMGIIRALQMAIAK